jgi:hypothetical protein
LSAADKQKKAAYEKERIENKPFLHCSFIDAKGSKCPFQTKSPAHLSRHEGRVHGIGDWLEKQPSQPCGFEGCEYKTPYKGALVRHRTIVHGIGGPEAAAVIRKKQRESEQRWEERQPWRTCDKCEYKTKVREGASEASTEGGGRWCARERSEASAVHRSDGPRFEAGPPIR